MEKIVPIRYKLQIMENYSFRYSFKTGLKISYRILIGGQIKVSSPMGEFKNPVGIEMHISQKIMSVINNEGLIGVCIDRVRAHESIPADQLPECGKESVMTMDPLGNVKWVDGQAAWQGAEHSMMRFPDEAISPGDSWVQQVEDARGSATPFFTRYLFKGLNRKNKRLAEFSTELFTGPVGEPDSKTAGNGIFYFDLDENWIDSCENFIEYHFQMPLPEHPQYNIVTETKLQIEMERLK